ncbi:beta-glucosidase [Microbacterium sp. cx-55]|uniref:beta-glucosidase family protein n=1 Tax=Microbacterium sp. cx-55 TaxID=2875948 RepID=UPI001CBAAE08|nr:beta-glucosidase [Microbacterium sp. cx-55]UGB36484.1 beta-glucosidase [Microbacterium sp. cx-55]
MTASMSAMATDAGRPAYARKAPMPPTAADLRLIEKAALVSGANVWQTRPIPRLGVPQIWLSDGPHGIRKQPGDADHLGLGGSEPAVCFPPAATIANSWDEELAAEIGIALGQEATARGVHVLLGPGLNIKRNPRGGRNFEYLSEDPELAGRLAAAYVRGIQSQGVAATPKHFAANNQELRRLVSDSVIDERTLRELYLTAFEIVVTEAAPWALMSSYNLVNGTYAHQNRHLLTDILREEWGFDGAVISDWGGADGPAASIAAGGTLEMPSPGFESAREIVRAIQTGRLDEAHLDARVNELLTLVRRVTAEARPMPGNHTEAHHRLARRAAAESAVLLRNESTILPLAPGARVALIGAFAEHPRYQGAGSSIVNPTRLTTLLSSIADAGLELVAYAPGFALDGRPDAALTAAAGRAAATADVAVVALGLPDADESEGIDRPHLHLPAAQVDALRAVAATGTPVVVVLSGGGPIETPWLHLTTALVHGYLGGQAGAEAIWDVLTGTVEPGGRLAETMPVSAADDPTSSGYPAQGRTAEYREGLFARYRFHTSAGVAPAFPFGFGLGYTRFAYADLTVDVDGATFTVTNVGAAAGADVPQLYVRRTGSSAVYRPDRELKGWSKIRVAPGERRTVTVPFGARTFRFFDVRSGRWEIEQGEYEVLVGPNSADLPLSATIHVAGTVPAGTPDPALAVYARGDVRDVPDAAFRALLGRDLPDDGWAVPLFRVNTPIDRLGQSPSRLVRFAFGFLERRKRRADAAAHPDLETQFIYYAPFRTLHKMTSATRPVTDAVLEVANGRVFRGLRHLVGALASGRRIERITRDAFERSAGIERIRRTRPPRRRRRPE